MKKIAQDPTREFKPRGIKTSRFVGYRRMPARGPGRERSDPSIHSDADGLAKLPDPKQRQTYLLHSVFGLNIFTGNKDSNITLPT